jgi:hypothetical protein
VVPNMHDLLVEDACHTRVGCMLHSNRIYDTLGVCYGRRFLFVTVVNDFLNPSLNKQFA